MTNNPLSYVDQLGLFITDAIGTCDDLFYSTTHAECPPERFEFDFRLGPGAGGGGGGGFLPGSNPEKPRPFPWLLLQLGFFAALESDSSTSLEGPCKITILRPGMTPVHWFDWCADNGMKLVWLADCAGDKNCCITKLGGYRGPCESQGFVYHVQIAAQLYGGWCCRDNR